MECSPFNGLSGCRTFADAVGPGKGSSSADGGIHVGCCLESQVFMAICAFQGYHRHPSCASPLSRAAWSRAMGEGKPAEALGLHLPKAAEGEGRRSPFLRRARNPLVDWSAVATCQVTTDTSEVLKEFQDGICKSDCSDFFSCMASSPGDVRQVGTSSGQVG